MRLKTTLNLIKIDYDNWMIFEELADQEEELWSIFKDICKDKETIKKEKHCAIGYFKLFVLDRADRVIVKMKEEGIITHFHQVDVILSLMLNLIPTLSNCGNCECEFEIYEYKRPYIRN